MSPRRVHPANPAAQQTAQRLAATIGITIRAARIKRRWTLGELAARAAVSRSAVHDVEAGKRSSLEMVAALAAPLGLRVEVELGDPRASRSRARHEQDFVHAHMGELEVAHLRGLGFDTAVDEPYQHYQFAGRGDVLGLSLDGPGLLHLENRTRFPDIQDMAGSWNAKRAYLAAVVASRMGVTRFASVTHVMVCLWSAEVLHALRLRRETFRSLCPGRPDAFEAWRAGRPPASGTSAALVLIDPFASGRQRAFTDLETAISMARPRLRDYAEAAERLRARGT